MAKMIGNEVVELPDDGDPEYPYGFIRVTETGEKLAIKRWLLFEKTEGREFKIMLTEKDTVLIALDSELSPTFRQGMHLSPESLALMMMCIVEGAKMFGIDIQGLLDELLGEKGALSYSCAPSKEEDQSLKPSDNEGTEDGSRN